MEKQWYEELFENYGKRYDQESFTRGTAGECDFIEKGRLIITKSAEFWILAAEPEDIPWNLQREATQF